MKVYAMTCGRLKAKKNIFIPDAKRGGMIEMPVPVFLIAHVKGNVLFDTGPNPEVFEDGAGRWGGLAKVFQPVGSENSSVVSQLARRGIPLDSIRYVVNSHLHFDHAGGNQFFSKATFLVSNKELMMARDPANEGNGYFSSDWNHRLDYQGIDGEWDIFGDGKLVIIPMPGHTPGHQILVVRRDAQKTLILSGDSAPLKENYHKYILSRNNIDNDQTLASMKKLHVLVEAENAMLIHGHDPDQWENIRIAPEGCL